MIRLTSAMWFAVFMRQETQRNAFVTVAKTGAQQAGAIFVVHNHLDGNATLYGPAPQAYLDEPESGRRFEKLLQSAPMLEVEAALEKQKKFDPDLWIIETEAGAGEPSLELSE